MLKSNGLKRILATLTFAAISSSPLTIFALSNNNTLKSSLNDNLIGHWTFEESNNKKIPDISGNNKNAELKGNSSIDENGLNGKSLKLTGEKGTFLSIPSIINAAEGNFSISLWAKVSENTSDNRSENTILIQQEGNGRSLLYWTSPNKGEKIGSFMDGTDKFATATMKKNEWKNITITSNKDSKTLEFYINGILDSSHPVNTLPNSWDKLRIGDHKGPDGLAFNGLVDDIRIYEKVLSPSEVSKIYSSEAPLETLKNELNNIIISCKELLLNFNKNWDEIIFNDMNLAIDVGINLIESNSTDKISYLNNFQNLLILKTKMEKVIDDSLGDTVLISADINDEVREISPALFGANHRYHKDGYGSFDAETMSIKKEFDELYKESKFGAIRYPGGLVSNLFEWKRSIGPVENRKKTIHGNPNESPEFPYFGLDEAANYAKENNSEFIYVYGVGNGNAQDAADLVEYLNCEVGENPNGGIDWAEIRAKNGHIEPYNVTHFELGNEVQFADQAYWMNASSDRINVYIDGGTFNFNNELVVEFEDWRTPTGKSNGESNQRKYIKYSPVEKDSVTLKVNNVIWNRVASFNDIGSENVYMLNEKTGEIIFGDGINGTIPLKDAEIKVSYRSHRDGFVDYYREMNKINPNIKLYSSYESYAFVDRMGSNKPYDGIAVHPYSGTIDANDPKYYEKILLRSEEKVNEIRNYEKKIASVVGEEKAKDVNVVVSEYGIFRDTSRFVKSQINGLYTAKSIIGLADLKVPYATKHCLVDFPNGDVLGPGQQAIIQAIENKENGEMEFIATPSAKVFTLFNNMTGNTVINEKIRNNKKLNISASTNLDALDVLITKDSSNNIYLTVVNADKNNIVNSSIQLDNYDLLGKKAEIWTVASPAFDSENTLDNKNNVDIEKSNLLIKNDVLEYSFKPHSVTAIKINTNTTVNKEDLSTLISQAENLYNNSIEGMDINNYHKGSKKTLNISIEQAKNISNNPEATLEDVLNGLDKLINSINLFNSLLITETTGDFNKNNKFDIGDLSLVSKNFGTNIPEYDLNKDGLINNYELEFINFKIYNN